MNVEQIRQISRHAGQQLLVHSKQQLEGAGTQRWRNSVSWLPGFSLLSKSIPKFFTARHYGPWITDLCLGFYNRCLN